MKKLVNISAGMFLEAKQFDEAESTASKTRMPCAD